MLIISRKKDESILIGDSGVKITVIDTGDGRVKLGVSAPKEIRIIRAEAAEASEFNIAATESRLPTGLLEKLKAQSGAIDQL